MRPFIKSSNQVKKSHISARFHSKRPCVVIKKNEREYIYRAYTAADQDRRHKEVVQYHEIEPGKGKKKKKKVRFLKDKCRCEHCGTVQWAPWPEWRIYGLCFECCHRKGKNVHLADDVEVYMEDGKRVYK